ncbi:hypothetical protein ACWGVR_14140 [Streptomyces xanthophaeus]
MAEQLIDVGIVAFVFTVAWILRRLTRTKPADQRHWNRTAQAAAVAEDVADFRQQNEVAQLEAWLQIPYRPRNTIPHQTRQTRRTEEDQ